MELKLFVDDTRNRPAGFQYAQSYEDCLMLYRAFGEFDFVDLDYDLNEKYTGLDILKWMKDNGKHPRHINIHSNHIEGMNLMRHYSEVNFPDSRVTMITLDK